MPLIILSVNGQVSKLSFEWTTISPTKKYSVDDNSEVFCFYDMTNKEDKKINKKMGGKSATNQYHLNLLFIGLVYSVSPPLLMCWVCFFACSLPGAMTPCCSRGRSSPPGRRGTTS